MNITSSVEDIIIYLTFTPWDELPLQLNRLGVKHELHEGNETLIITNGKFPVGFTDSDPVSKAVMLALSFVGEQWYLLLPNVLDRVKQEWKQRSRRGKKG